MIGERHDVVVVGSGSAGCVVARRLVDAGVRVCLVEAGGPDDNPAIHDPTRVTELWDSPQDWGYRTVPQEHCAGRSIHWPRGKVLGGSSSQHGMIYIRGHRSDYDAWAYAGCHGWGWSDVLPLFKRSEDFDGGPSEYHGAGGELHVMSRYEPHPFNAAVVEAAQEAGVPFNPDHNGAELDGVGFPQLLIEDGKRASNFRAFVAPVLDRPNLTVTSGARARALLFEGSRCVGVEVAREGRAERIEAEHEVVVCAGAIESPKLLLLSGIGPASKLAPLGIDVRVELAGVGENLQEHAVSPLIYASSRPLPPPLPGLIPHHSHLFARSRPGLIGPDLQPLIVPVPAYTEDMSGPAEAFTLYGGLVRPASRGSMRLASADPEDAPLLDPAYLAEAIDVEALAISVEQCREIARSPALDDWRGEELYPGPEARSRAELRDYVRRSLGTYHHQVGTCRMGVDAGSVVDPELRVYGVDGLRVADASIMPSVVSGNTHAAATMIGERAADLVGAALA